MSALSAKPRRRRRKPGFAVLAFITGRSKRQIHRWITDRPELRPVLRVRRVGKQWRVQLPETVGEFAAWEASVLKEVKQFARTPQEASSYATGIAKALGYGDAERDRDVVVLRAALLLKRLDADLRESPDGEVTLTDLDDWKRESDNLCGVARIVSSRFNCRVEHAPRHWRDDDQCDQWAQLWPEAGHWKRARAQQQEDWELRTLAEAARELVFQEKGVVGRNLARFVFRDQKTEHCWKHVQFVDAMRSRGVDLLPPGENERKFAKRGISLREFRNRYDGDAVKKVRLAVQSDASLTAIGTSESSKLDAAVKLDAAEIQDMTTIRVTARKGTVVEHDAHHGRNGRVGVSKRFQNAFDSQLEEQLQNCSPEERAALEKEIGPVDSYGKNLDTLIPKKSRKKKL